MSTLLLDGADRVAGASVWTRVTDQLWAASDPEGFLGTVERIRPDRYAATDGRGTALGTAPTLHDAQALVTSNDPAAAGIGMRRRVTAATAWIAGLAAIASLAVLVLDVTR